MVESKTVKHLAHIETDFAADSDQDLSDLLEHCVIVDIDFDERSIIAIDKRKVTIRAKVRTTIR